MTVCKRLMLLTEKKERILRIGLCNYLDATYRFHELELFSFLDFLQENYIFQRRLEEVTLLHLQASIRLRKKEKKRKPP